MMDLLRQFRDIRDHCLEQREEAGVEATGLSHVLSGKGLDVMAQRLEKRHAQVDEDPSDHNLRRFADTVMSQVER